jgi:putative transcriptional regulator
MNTPLFQPAFGRRLRKLRIKRDLTQDALAIELGIDQRTVSRLEIGEEPTLRLAASIAGFFGVSIGYILRNGKKNAS